MPLHPFLVDKLHLLDGIPSIEVALADPDMAPRLAQFMFKGEQHWPEAHVADRTIPGPHGPVRVGVYTPVEDAASSRPAVLWAHGGGFRIGSIDDPGTDAIARYLCARAGAVVVTVDYRLAADGVRYPVPHDDVVAAIQWLRITAGALGADVDRICVGGDSAGGNLAAGAVLKLRDTDKWTPCVLLLAYPHMHPVLPPLSDNLREAVETLPDLLRFLPSTVEDINGNYLGGPPSGADGYAMPGLAVLEGLCPTVIANAEFDDLRASGEAFTAALARAGVDVHQITARGMLHAFLVLPDSFEPAAQVREAFAAAVRQTTRTAMSEPQMVSTA